jgi:acyl-CoA thioesterase-2
VDEPVVLHVDRDRDGGSFSARRVHALQGDDVIFSMIASFQVPVPGVLYDSVPTRVGSNPEALSGRLSPLLVEIREVTPTRVGDGQIRHSDQLWVRAASELPDDPLVHACAVAYLSDLGSGFGQVEIEGLAVDGPSLDHSVWFHAPIRADEWTLLELWPLKAASSRGIYQGSLRNRAGVLGAALAQEMFLRDRSVPPDVLQQMAEYLGVAPPEEPAAGAVAN